MAQVEAHADQNRAVNEKRYLKSPEDFRHIGVKVPLIRKETKAFSRAHKDLDHDDVIVVAEELWSREVHESRMAAIELLNARLKSLTADDASQVEKMINQSHTWAYVDNLSAHTMAGLVERFPELTETLDGWAEHENFWLRRAAMLTLLIPLRDGEGDFERFGRYADSMLHEKEFFIRKAIGWVLRDMSKKRPELVLEWLAPRAHRCSTLTVREASKYLPAELREAMIAASKSGEPMFDVIGVADARN